MEKNLEFLKNKPQLYKYIDNDIKNVEFALKNIQNGANIVPFLEKKLKKNILIIDAALNLSPENIEFFPEIPKEAFKNFLLKNSTFFNFNFPIPHSTDEDIIKIIENKICTGSMVINLRYLPQKLIKNNEIAKIYIKKNGGNIKYFPKATKLKKLIKKAISNNPEAYLYINQKLKSDEDFIKDLLQINPYLYKLLEDKSTYSYYLISKVDSIYFDWLPEKDMQSPDILLKYLESHELISPHIKLENFPTFFTCSDKVLTLMEKNGKYFPLIDSSLKISHEICIKALKSGAYINDIPRCLLENKEFAKKVVEIDGEMIKFFNEDVKRSLPIVKRAINQNPNCIKWLDESILKRKNITQLILSINGGLIFDLPKNVKEKKENIELAIKTSPEAIALVKDNNIEFWKKELSEKPERYKFYPDFIKKDKQLAFKAVKKFPENIRYVNTNFRNNHEFLNLISGNDSLIKEFGFNLALSDEVIKLPHVLKLLIIKEPHNPFYLNNLSLKLHKSLILELLEKVQMPVHLLPETIFSDIEILEKALETQIISCPLDAYLYNNRDYVLKAVKNNPEIVLDEFQHYIPLSEDLLKDAIYVNSEVIDLYYRTPSVEVSINFVRDIIVNRFHKINEIFKSFSSIIDKKCIFLAIDLNKEKIEKKSYDANYSYSFLKLLSKKNQKDFDILLKYIASFNVNIEYFNFSVSDVIQVLLFNNSSHLLNGEFQTLISPLSGDNSYKEYFKSLKYIFGFSAIVSLDLMEKKLKSKETLLKSIDFNKMTSFNPSLSKVISWLVNFKISFINIPFKLTKGSRRELLDIIRCYLLSQYHPKEDHLDLIEVYYSENISPNDGLSDIFSKKVSSFTKNLNYVLDGETYLVDNLEKEEVIDYIVLNIREAFFDFLPLRSNTLKATFSFSDSYESLFFHGISYPVKEFFINPPTYKKWESGLTSGSRIRIVILKSLEVLFKNSSLNQSDVKDIFFNIIQEEDEYKFLNNYSPKYLDKFELFTYNFNKEFSSKGISLDFNRNNPSSIIKINRNSNI